MGGFYEMGSSRQVQRTHHKPGKKRDTEDREKSHPQACPKREMLTVYPPVYGSVALLVWIKVRDLTFSFKSFFRFKFMQEAPLLPSFFASAGRSAEELPKRSIDQGTWRPQGSLRPITWRKNRTCILFPRPREHSLEAFRSPIAYVSSFTEIDTR